MLQQIANFFNHPLFVIIGGVSTLVVICAIAYSAYLAISGVLPVWYRLGIGLSQRSIAVFAEPSEFEKLQDMLASSKIFKKQNIIAVTKDRMSTAKQHTVFLVHWKEFQDKIDEILAMKDDSTALVIYAPTNEGRIADDKMELINSHRNAIVVNFRGRLLNDIFASLITTSYAKK